MEPSVRLALLARPFMQVATCQRTRKSQLVNKTETIKKRIGEGAWMYRSGSLEKKIQSLLNGQGVHLPEVGIVKDGGNSPSGELRMRKQRVLTPYSTKAIPPHFIRHCKRGGAAPRDEGTPKGKKKRTSKGGLAALPEESPAPTADEGEEEAPIFRILPRAGGQPSGEVGVFHFMLLFFFYSTSRRARSSPRVGFAIRGSETEGEKDFEIGGFMTERGEGLRKGSRAGLASDDPEISDLMSSG